jgi:DNA-binding CsgD family transcriptional regulator
MREVSVRMLHLAIDLARAGGVDEAALLADLPSVVPQDGKHPEWFDWDDFVEIFDRLSRMAGGPEAFGRLTRLAMPTAYPDLRAFAAIFPDPLAHFAFVQMRLMHTWFRHIEVKELERFADGRIRWRQTIPEPHRESVFFLQAAAMFAKLLPVHLGLPDAEVEITSLTPREAEYIARFTLLPVPADGAHPGSAATALMGAQLDDAFLHIAETLRSVAPPERISSAPPTPIEWAEKLELSPRQREVFALLVEARANKDIASMLHCSERNVEFHVGRILRAARVSSRAELLVKVLGARGV